MRKNWRSALVCAVFGATALSFALSARTSEGQQPARPRNGFRPYQPARMADGHPDLNGIWQAFVTANNDLQDHPAKAGPYSELTGEYGAEAAGMSIVEGGEIPYLPSALAKKEENYRNRLKVDVSDDSKWHALGDPEAKCYLPGIPRATYLPFPFQIVQGTYPYILMSYEFDSANRVIRMNWKDEAPGDSWMGWSRGRWEGDTLVIDVSGFRPETWLDRAGDYHSDALHVVERYTPASPYHLMYEATIEDKNVYSRPWKISFPLYRRMEKNIQLLEYKCVPFTERLIYGPFFKKPGTTTR